MTALHSLADRVEAASGLDAGSAEMRTLNRDILVALGWRQDARDVIDPAGNLAFQVPYYLGSLDAAMSLVPKGAGGELLSIMLKRSYVGKTDVLLLDSLTGEKWSGASMSMAAAVTAAALRALAATKETK